MLGKKISFLKVVLFIFLKPDCETRPMVKSGIKVQVPYSNEHFDITTMEIGSGAW